MNRALVALLALDVCACEMPGRRYHPASAFAEGPAIAPFGPRGGGEPSAKESPARMRWRAAMPRSPVERRLSNGVPVVVVPRRDFPSVEVLFVLDRGASGVAALYAQALLGDSAVFDEHEAYAYLRFGALPRLDASPPPTVVTSPPSCAGHVQVVDRPGAKQSAIAIGWPGAAAGEPDAGALELVAAASGGWLSSRLNLTVRKELGASYGVHARAVTLRHGGTLELTTAVETPRTADSLAGIVTENERLRTEPLEAAELDGAKTKALYGDSGRSNHGIGALLAHAAAAGLPAAHVAEHASRRRALSAEDVRAAAERRLDPKDRCIVVVGDAAEIVKGIEALGLGAVDVARAAR